MIPQGGGNADVQEEAETEEVSAAQREGQRCVMCQQLRAPNGRLTVTCSTCQEIVHAFTCGGCCRRCAQKLCNVCADTHGCRGGEPDGQPREVGSATASSVQATSPPSARVSSASWALSSVQGRSASQVFSAALAPAVALAFRPREGVTSWYRRLWAGPYTASGFDVDDLHEERRAANAAGGQHRAQRGGGGGRARDTHQGSAI